MAWQIAWQLLLSASAVAALVLLARALGFGGAPPLSAEAAARELAEALVGFAPVELLLSADGSAALALGADGGRALVARVGDRWAVRRIGPSARLCPEAGAIRVDCGEPGLRAVRIALDGPPPAWTGAGVA